MPISSVGKKTRPKKSVPKARPLARKRGELKREKILWEAATAFAERGYSATTLTDIAAAADTHAGSLYYHFESRDDITREVLKCALTTMDRVKEAWAELPPDTPAIERIRAGIVAHVRTILSDDPFLPAYNRIINEIPLALREEFASYPIEYGTMWRDVFLESQAAGEIDPSLDMSVARMMLFGSLNNLPSWFDPKGGQSVDEIAATAMRLFSAGMLTDRGRAVADGGARAAPKGAPSKGRSKRPAAQEAGTRAK